MPDITVYFEQFFFGGGITSLIALLFLLMAMIGLNLKWKYSAMFTLVIALYVGFEYYERINPSGDFAWHIILILLYCITACLMLVLRRK